MNKITPFLWFNDQAEEAALFYTSIFPEGRILHTSHYGKAGPGPEGSVMVVSFEIAGQPFNALNGGPMFSFTEATSFVVNCDTQEEIDHFWNALTENGQESQCGWLKDKFGLSWQIVPTQLGELMSTSDPAAKNRVMNAMFEMRKFDIAKLKAAAEAV